MYSIDERMLEQYFYYGYENVQELLEGIIYVSTKEMHKVYSNLEEQYKTTNDKQLSQIKEIAYGYGVQYYRFIELNKKSNRLVNYKTKNELQEVKNIIDKTIKDVEEKKCLIEYNVGYYFLREEEAKYLDIYENDHRIRKFCAIEVVEQLKQLSIQEKEDPIGYYKNWINVRLRTAESREKRCDSEIGLIQHVKKQLNERIANLENNKEGQELN